MSKKNKLDCLEKESKHISFKGEKLKARKTLKKLNKLVK